MASTVDLSVLYVDPSYTGTGLYLLDRAAKRMEFGLIAPDRKTMRSYENYFATALVVEREFSSYLLHRKPVALKLEVPPPVGQTSAGLTGLSYVLLASVLRVRGLTGYPERIELISPYFISTQQKKMFSDLSSRSDIAKAFLSIQKKRSPGLVIENEALLEDNDVATAYLFYMFEAVAEGAKPFPVLPAATSSFYTTQTPLNTTHHHHRPTTTDTEPLRGSSRKGGPSMPQEGVSHGQR